MPELLYIQYDGKVFLVEKPGMLAFPRAGDAIPFPIDRKKSFVVSGVTVHYCEPRLGRFPESWMWREDAILSGKVEKTAREAMAFVSPYIVGKAVILDNQRNIVVVKGSRGGNTGKYTVPGGIAAYGETSREATIREAKEECGLDVAIVKLITVAEGCDATGRHSVRFIYLCQPAGGTLRPNMDDVCEAFWEPLDQAIAKYDYYVFGLLKDYLGGGGTL